MTQAEARLIDEPFSSYMKKEAQLMRPYVNGEDMTGISVAECDTPEVGGMIAVNPKDKTDRWYIAKQFFLDNYQAVGVNAVAEESPLLAAEGISFSEALMYLKAGQKIAREGWNGKGMWVSMTEGRLLDMKTDDIWTQNVKEVAAANGGIVEMLPYMVMKTADGKIQIGWLASQSDVLCNDWCVLK